ncbi:E3 ubiquitin-protein ligase MIB2-like [Gigantopelta aegis]|uniref:E3 ubiquitin-protein ligase MIB2-like n=1 Tax=Gigantopelta aegis TaxID=1735272 RepID=UPI001B88C663|nr:E3 ubiquitin-protein ligase MIB2-like [Gigantopelta aegis]
MAGLRVIRGHHWEQGNDDGGEGHLGTIVNVNGDNTADVVWDNGNQTRCKIGKDGKHELLVFDNATVGVRHTDVTCDGCDEDGIFGMRWKCVVCRKCDLCPLCYVRDKHDLTHEFIRFTTPNSSGVKVRKRSSCQRIQSTGIFPGATVVRGTHWKWSNQDGGPGSPGTVKTVEYSRTHSATRNTVAVTWDNGNSNICRVGANGMMDLKCVEECPGIYYYKDHLPQIEDVSVQASPTVERVPRSTSEDLHEGDTVCIKLSEEVLKAKQNEVSGWTAGMANCIGKLGVIKSFTPTGEAMVEFEGLRLRFYQGALQKVPKLSVGDIVRIMADEEKVKVMQKSNGGWEKNMVKALGKCGKVIKVDEDRGVVIGFGQKTWVFNPVCCTPAPGNVVDVINASSSSSSSSSSDSSPTSSMDGSQGQNDMQDQLLKMLAGLLVKKDPGAGLNINSDILYVAIVEGNVDLVRTIARIQPSLINAKHKGVTPLIIAAREGQMDIVTVLLENKAQTEAADDKGNTALCFALNAKKEKVAELLLEEGAQADMCNKDGRTPLHFAAYANLHRVMGPLIKYGCPVNAQDDEGDTALHDAISKGNQGAIDIICRAARIDFTVTNNKGFNPIQLASLRDCPLAVERILQRDKGTANSKMVKHLFTPLHIAVNNNHVQCARLLIVEGSASLNSGDENGVTPLHLACHSAYYESAELLAEKGASLNLKDKLGNTPLHLAVASSKNSGDLLAELLRRQSCSEDESRVKIACMLIQKGASYDIRNILGATALQAAKNETIRRGIQSCIDSRSSGVTLSTTPEATSISLESLLNLNLPCAKCLCKTAVITIKPCDHKVLCRECCLRVEKCPMCETLIQRRLAHRSDSSEQRQEACKVQ